MLQRWAKRVTETMRANLRRGALFALGGFIAIVMVVSPLMARPAQAQGLFDLASLGGSFTNGLSSCAIETVGWVICPTMRSIAKLADYGFTYVNSNFLRLDYALLANDSGTYTAWEIMRTIANAAFVVAFMVLVYSQISGRGSGGYSIKRLIPRLIIAAIAVNVSYYLCVVLIDVSNIMGDSILNLLKGLAERIGTTVMPVGKPPAAFQDGTLTVITSSIMAKTGIAWVLLAPVAAVIVSIATISAAMLVLLIMRKTVVTMLVLASPLLFVAYLLPNLERFFSQGVRLFIQLLMLYPIIAMLLGAGQIVSATIVTVGSNDANYRVSGDNYFSKNGGSGSAITDLTAAAAAVLPLVGVWFLFKNMSTLMSTAGSRLSAAVKGRRGDDKEARVTGKATAGAQNQKQQFGGNQPNRRQAFTRRRRLDSVGLDGSGMKLPASEAGQPPVPMMAGGASQREQDESKDQQQQDEKRRQDLENQMLNADADGINLDAAGGGGADGQKVIAQKDDKEQVKAKDIFSAMNRKQGHDSKDKDRKFSAGPAPAGGGGGGGGGEASGSAGQSAPVVGYRAPQIAQNSNIVTGSAAGVQPVKVVAVPVQVDASSLLGQNRSVGAAPEVGQPPVTGMQEKAKARAQKYIFDAEKDLEDARNRQDILGKKDNDGTKEQRIHHDKKDGEDE